MEYYEKCESLRKTERNNTIRLMRQYNRSYQDIGDYFGITRQRVHQILNDYVSTIHIKSQKEFNENHPICEICKSKKTLHTHHIDKNKRNNNPKNLMRLCVNCHHQIHKGVITTRKYSKKYIGNIICLAIDKIVYKLKK